MNWNVILTTGVILLSGAFSAQSAEKNQTKNQILNSGYTYSDYHRVPSFRRLDLDEVNKDRRAAERGDASAQFKMALRYDSGQGVPQNYTKAVEWLHKAAEQGFVKAQYNLGSMYYSGQGVPQDNPEAAKWFLLAAERGFASAQKNLGAQYGLGQGVPQNDGEAFVWSSIAAMSGDEGAVNNRDFAASKLSSEDLDAAQKRATKLYEEIQQRKEGE
jgi:TPR repeat protein